MPFHIHIDPPRRRIHTQAVGRIGAEDLRRYYRDLRAHPDFEPTFDELFDASGVTEVAVSAAELRDFSMTTAPFTGQGRGVKVAVVASTDLTFGLARMYELSQTASTNELLVVRSRAEAETWLAASRVGGSAHGDGLTTASR